MTIKIGDRLPEGQLQEFIDVETEGCPLGPNTFSVGEITKGKKIAIFGLPGRLHAHLLGEARAGLCREVRRAESEGRRRDLVPVGQRRVRDGRLGP